MFAALYFAQYWFISSASPLPEGGGIGGTGAYVKKIIMMAEVG